MKLQDVKRIDDLIVNAREISRSRSFPNTTANFNEALNVSEQDLEFLRRQEEVSLRSENELISEYGGTQDGLREKLIESTNHANRLKQEINDLEKSLSWYERLTRRKSTISERRKNLENTRDEYQRVRKVCNDLGTKYYSIINFILTNQGVFIGVKGNAERYVDLAFEPTKIITSGNSINGKFVVFTPEGDYYDSWVPYYQTIEGAIVSEYENYDPKGYGEEVQLKFDVPYDKLTQVEDIDRRPYENGLIEWIPKSARFRLWDVKKGKQTYINDDIIGVLNFPDKRYCVFCHITSYEFEESYKVRVGSTTGTIRIPDSGYDTSKDVELDLYARCLEGTFTFDLLFLRIKAYQCVDSSGHTHPSSSKSESDFLLNPFLSKRDL